jgi:deoxyribodipyrimidine photolyase-related protein
MLNIGLITPNKIIYKIIKFFNNLKNKDEIFNNVEGFIRQIIGWREFTRFIYIFYYDDIIEKNYFNFKNKL